MRIISKRRGVPALADGKLVAPCYQPIWWYFANALRGVSGKELLDPVLLCALDE